MKRNRKLRKPSTPSKLVLKEIIGLTTKNGNGLASNVSTPNCAYIAGCVVVLYNLDSGTQSYLMVSHRMPKPLSCVALSQDGRFVAAGESGNQTAVLIWDCTTLALMAELKGHTDGVTCIAFSPDGKHLVSVGGYIYLWDMSNRVLAAKIKACSSCSAVTSVSFSSDAKFIVTAGKKHLKFWAVGSSRTCRSDGAGSLALYGKPVNLGSHKGSSFIDVTSILWTDNCSVSNEPAAKASNVYALTDRGVLCLLDSGLTVKKSVELKVEKGFSLCASKRLIACACSSGIVQLAYADTLMSAGSILYSKAKNTYKGNKDFQPLANLPDAVACQFSTPEKLVVVYRDHTINVWDINHVTEATRCCSLVSHSSCIWDIKTLSCDNMHHPSIACVAKGCSGGVSFVTCSADGTIRLWDLELESGISSDNRDHHCLTTEPTSTAHLVSSGIFERDMVEPALNTQGFRSMAISSDGKYLAAGDTIGNVHIYDLQTSDYTCLQDSHNAEILSLSFSLLSKDSMSEETLHGHNFLVSGGRDRIIHLYDVRRNFDLTNSIDDHSAAVTSVQLACNGSKILSCSADRSLVFRDITITNNGWKISRSHHQMASCGTVYDMAVDPNMKFAITVAQDKKINIFSIAGGKLVRSFKQDKEFGEPIKVTLDPSCSYLLCMNSNKSISMYDFTSGDLVAQAMGHGEVITGAIFLPDCKHIVTVGGDSCIFVWKVPAPLSSKMLRKIKETSGPLSSKDLAQPVAFTHFTGNAVSLEELKENEHRHFYKKKSPQKRSSFKFSISRLPKWAQAKVTKSDIVSGGPAFSSSQLPGTTLGHQQQGEMTSVSSFSVDDNVKTPSNDQKSGDSYIHSVTNIATDSESKISSMVKGSLSFAMDKQWLTVYNVCLDLVDSPEMQYFEDANKSLLPSNSLQDTAEVQNTNKQVDGNSNLVEDDGHNEIANYICKDDKRLGVHHSFHKAISRDAEEKPCSPMTKSKMEAFRTTISHVEDGDIDLFKQHFGNLSVTHKAERNKSTPKRYSSRFFVRRSCTGDCKNLFSTPVRNTGGATLKCNDRAPKQVTQGNLELQTQKQEMMGSCKEQDPRNSPPAMLSVVHIPSQSKLSQVTGSSRSFELDVKGQEECHPDHKDLHEKVIQCREALRCLDAAAENAVQSLSNLTTLVPVKEVLDGSGARLYNEAAELLPSIAGKVSTLSKLVQCGSIDSNARTGLEVANLEPLLGAFAESLSQKVVEVLKGSLGTD